ncbi:MAG: hypothetical protein U0521_06815 [Anaerolineae bacterium]
MLSFGALFCVVVGGALLAPVVIIAAMRLLTPITRVLFGALGRMAPRAITARSAGRQSPSPP